jgi:CelD/BcsL family acetyltransferase involved in cellulose biosynthesis
MYSRRRMTLTAEVLDTLEKVEPTVAEWDRLAVGASRPYCAPAWLLAWWRHAAPANARLAVIAVRDGDRLVGIAPFWAERRSPGLLWEYSLLGTDITSRIEPVAARGAIAEVATAVSATLHAADPYPDLIRMEGVPADSPWPAYLLSSWPGRRRPWVHKRPSTGAPTVALDADDLDSWLGKRSSNFRQQMRRGRRKLEKQGAIFRVTESPDELERDLAEFARLHLARWEWRGGSMSLREGIDAMLHDAGTALLAEGRFRLASVELDGKVINSQLFVAAGGEVSYWNGGFDDAYAALKPSYMGLVDAISRALDAGDHRLDLGPGEQEYKYRFSDGQDTLEWLTLIPPGPRYALARASFSPIHARYAITHRMTPEQKQRARELVQRVRG